MNKRKITGVLSIGVPILWLITVIFSYYMSNYGSDEIVYGGERIAIVLLVVSLVAELLIIFSLTVIYMVNAVKNKRTIWVLFLYAFSVFAVPVYWYKYMYRESQGGHNG